MAGQRKAAVGPVETKVLTATAGAGISGAIVVLLMNLINGAAWDQTALQTVLTGVVTAVIAYGAGYLKTTPFAVLVARTDTARVNAAVNEAVADAGPGTQPPPFAPEDIGAADPTKPTDPPTPGAKP